jgi:hypothetical protein
VCSEYSLVCGLWLGTSFLHSPAEFGHSSMCMEARTGQHMLRRLCYVYCYVSGVTSLVRLTPVKHSTFVLSWGFCSRAGCCCSRQSVVAFAGGW